MRKKDNSSGHGGRDIAGFMRQTARRRRTLVRHAKYGIRGGEARRGPSEENKERIMTFVTLDIKKDLQTCEQSGLCEGKSRNAAAA